MAEGQADLSSTTRRLCIFSFHDADGIVDDYVVYLLQALARHVERILIYSSGPLSRDSEIALRALGHEVVQLQPTDGDVSAYREGLAHIDFDEAGHYDEVLMVNHDCYGPIFPFEELFSAMARRTCDFWGITASVDTAHKQAGGGGAPACHLDMHFIAVRKPMLQSLAFRNYWEASGSNGPYVVSASNRQQSFTQYFNNLGYTSASYLDCAKYGTRNPAVYDIDETVADRNPMIPRRVFLDDPTTLEHNAVDLPRALRIMAEASITIPH